MYQKCPICNGSGKTGMMSTTAIENCRVCSGEGIISELTGKPPKNGEAKKQEVEVNRPETEKGDSKTQYVKLMEEAGELAKALLTKNRNETIDAIGDIVVVLTNLAHLEGLKLEDCVVSAYTEIANRKGSMQYGTFVNNSGTVSTQPYYTGLTNTAKGSVTNTFNSTL